MVPGLSAAAPLTDKGGTQNQDRAQGSGSREALAQEDPGKKQGGDRVKIAENSDGLRGQVHTAEIQHVGDPRVDDPHQHQQGS